MNLKSAAQELGVHYQTAYKWVRSGALTAVRIGGRYEISGSAIEQFEATRKSMIEVPRQRDEITAEHTRDDVLDELEAMALDPILTDASASSLAARRGAAVLGDCCTVVLIHDDGTLGFGLIEHREPDRTAFVGAIARSMSMTPTIEANATMAPLATGTALRISHIPQDELRAAIRPELHQHLPQYSIHSLISVPISADDTIYGVMTFLRDSPGNPYTNEDEHFVEQVAFRLGLLIQSSRELKQAWKVRAKCVEAIQAHVAEHCHRDVGNRHTPDSTELERVLAGIPETANVAVAVLDPEGRPFASSEPLRRLSGWSNPQLTQAAANLTHPEDLAESESAKQRLLSGEIGFLDSHTRFKRADGDYVEVATHRASVSAPDASLICIVTVVRPLRMPPVLDRPLAPTG